MRVVLVANDTTFIYNLRREILESFVQNKYEVYVLSQVLQFRKDLEAIGCNVIDIETTRRGTNPFKDVALFRRYYSALSEIQPDVVFTNSIKPNVYAGLACQMLGIKYVPNVTGLGTAVENSGPLQTLTTRLYRLGISGADCIFFQNRENQQFFVEHHMLPKCARVRLLPGSGVNLKQHCYEEYPSESGGIRFLFVGRIMRDKGIEEFLACAEIIRQNHPNCVFDIVGGYDDESYRQIIERFEREGVIKSFGNQNDIHSFMKSHHVLIQPSYHEGLSNVLLEAAACGRPVLASNIPGCRETFDEGISGIGFEPGNEETLVHAVEKILAKTAEERRLMGIAGRKKVEKEFDRQFVIRTYLNEI